MASALAGLVCRRLKAALVAGAILALLYGLLVIIGLWQLLDDADLPYFLGALTAFCLAILAAAVLRLWPRRGLVRLRDTRLTRRLRQTVAALEQLAEHGLHPFEIERLGKHDRVVEARRCVETAVACGKGEGKPFISEHWRQNRNILRRD